MLAPAIARELRGRGHDVEAVSGHAEREALTDREIMALVRSEQRALVTNNLRDFRPLHNEAVAPGGPGHWGMIFMSGNYRRRKADTGRIIAALEARLAEYPGDDALANSETWL
jgi:predicted nuclease of predicted toxin-antitoxin system